MLKNVRAGCCEFIMLFSLLICMVGGNIYNKMFKKKKHLSFRGQIKDCLLCEAFSVRFNLSFWRVMLYILLVL